MKGKGLKALLGERPVDKELIKALKVMDDLLGKLPEDAVEEFSKSKDYEVYCRVLERYGVK